MRVAFRLMTGLVVVIAAAGVVRPPLSAEEPAAPAPALERKWFVEVGPFWRAGGDVDFKVKSLPAIPFSRPSAVPTSKVGPADRVADRQYDDGFVRMDYGTGVWDTDTWYWGYDRSGQVVGNNLVFHGSTFAAGGQSLPPRDAFSLDLDDEFGGELRIGRTLFGCKSVTGAVILGGGFTSFSGSTGFDDLGYVWSSQGGLITDTYNLFTDPSLVPPAPYSGTKEGPGYVIPNIPAKRDISGGRGGSGPPLTEIFHSVRQDLDVDLWVVSLGFGLRAGGPRVSWLLGAGLTGNFLSADSAFSWAAIERGVALDSMQVSDDDCTFELGAYGEAGICFGLSRRMTVILRARYDQLFDDAKVDFSNTTADIDLSGVSAIAGIGISL